MTSALVGFDTEALLARVSDKLVRAVKHPAALLTIYNYTERAQYSKAWDEITEQCRGLILDTAGEVVARPFRKFFNLDEHLGMGREIPAEPFHVFEKLDGSLGITYWVGDQPYIATRGSFTSEQAQRANEMLRTQYGDWAARLDPRFTYLFEIIYPANRIVVDYGADERLSLLAVIETATGAEQGRVDWWPHLAGYHGEHTFEDKFIDGQRDNAEGYVLYWPSRGLRVKVKFDEYKRLHRLITGISAKHIWESLRAGDPLDELYDRVPDEFYAWVKKTADDLTAQFRAVEVRAQEAFEKRPQTDDRKTIAAAFAPSDLRSILFAMLDAKPYADIIWKMLRPEAERPFKVDES